MAIARACLVGLIAAALSGVGLPGKAAEYLGKSDYQKQRAYSPAVISRGGKVVWLAGHATTMDENGKDISGNFEAQARTVFGLIDKTLKGAGGSLQDMVTMTVFIKDARSGDKFVALRKEMFSSGNYPASALITVSAFARPGIELEIQGVAVIGDECSDAKPCAK